MSHTLSQAERTMDKIRHILERDFSPTHFVLTNESHLHQHHPQKGTGGHFNLHIQSALFNKKTLVERHRMIYTSLQELMDREIHAISMKCEPTEK